jgi:hypothetical protein
MQYPTLESHFMLPSIPSVYPGQEADWKMSPEYFKHHSGWTASHNFEDQLALFEHATVFDVSQVRKHHERHMRKIARMNGYDAASRFERMSIKLLQRAEAERAMTID